MSIIIHRKPFSYRGYSGMIVISADYNPDAVEPQVGLYSYVYSDVLLDGNASQAEIKPRGLDGNGFIVICRDYRHHNKVKEFFDEEKPMIAFVIDTMTTLSEQRMRQVVGQRLASVLARESMNRLWSEIEESEIRDI